MPNLFQMRMAPLNIRCLRIPILTPCEMQCWPLLKITWTRHSATDYHLLVLFHLLTFTDRCHIPHRDCSDSGKLSPCGFQVQEGYTQQQGQQPQYQPEHTWRDIRISRVNWHRISQNTPGRDCLSCVYYSCVCDGVVVDEGHFITYCWGDPLGPILFTQVLTPSLYCITMVSTFLENQQPYLSILATVLMHRSS